MATPPPVWIIFFHPCANISSSISGKCEASTLDWKKSTTTLLLDTTYRYRIGKKEITFLAPVVAQLVERSLLIREGPGLNSVSAKIYVEHLLSTVY